MTFKVPHHVHLIIKLSRIHFGRREYSDLIDQGLHALDNYTPSDLDLFQTTLKCLFAEQQYLLPGFRHIVIRPGRVGGRVQVICTRIPMNLFTSCFSYIKEESAEYWLDCSGGYSNHQWDPSVISEYLALVEVFPESLIERTDDNSFDWWRDKTFFEDRLREIGLKAWDANEDEKIKYYTGIKPSLIREEILK